MPPLSVATTSREYVRCQITATEAGATVDPTAYPVDVAITAPGTDPADSDWQPASWEAAGSSYYARVLIGPGSPVGALPVGAHQLWVRVHADPELPAKNAGQLYVY